MKKTKPNISKQIQAGNKKIVTVITLNLLIFEFDFILRISKICAAKLLPDSKRTWIRIIIKLKDKI